MPKVPVAPRTAFRCSADDAAATITLTTTSGTTVIRMAFTQIVPSGAMIETARSAAGLRAAATISPAIVPRRTAITIWTGSFFMRGKVRRWRRS